jgi:chromosome partitioning protein
MKTIAIASRKGGAGKTTLAAHLSVLAESGGARVVLIDADPQGSLTFWYRLRSCATPQLVECKASELARILDRARRESVAVCIIDTPPHADLVLVPTRPGPFDLAAAGATLDMARSLGKAPLVVLNAAPPRTGASEPSIVADAREAVHNMGAVVMACVVSQRVALSHAIIDGLTVGEFEPAGRAAGEVAALWRELQTHFVES